MPSFLTRQHSNAGTFKHDRIAKWSMERSRHIFFCTTSLWRVLMVAIDEYSRFPEVEILTSTSARAVIPKLDAIYARQGIPDVLKSDNGPPFNSHEFTKFVEHLGFQHRRITPYWPKSNGEAEYFMRTLGKCTRSAHAEGGNWKPDLHKFLRQYRATPHSKTNISPCETLNQRKLKTTLPEPSHSQTIPYNSYSNMKITQIH